MSSAVLWVHPLRGFVPNGMDLGLLGRTTFPKGQTTRPPSYGLTEKFPVDVPELWSVVIE